MIAAVRRWWVGLALVALLLAGCGGSTGVRPSAYVRSICTALGSWKNTIQSAGLALQSSGAAGASRAVAKEDYQKFVGALLTATTRATGALRSAGTPAVSHGRQLAGSLTGAFAVASRRLPTANAQARSIPTDTASTFALAAGSVTTEIKSALQGLVSVTPGRSPQLRSAAAKQPACQVLQG
jgi:hypothetical protein